MTRIIKIFNSNDNKKYNIENNMISIQECIKKTTNNIISRLLVKSQFGTHQVFLPERRKKSRVELERKDGLSMTIGFDWNSSLP